MKTTAEWAKLARLYKIEEKIVEAFNKAVDTKNFPAYYDRWCVLHRNIGNAIIDLKYM